MRQPLSPLRTPLSPSRAQRIPPSANNCRIRARAADWLLRNGSPIARIRSPLAWRSITSGCVTSAPRWSTTCSTSACVQPQPRNQPLLDWLAVELMDHGWQMKHIHRLLVTSNTYRMASTAAGASAANVALDRDNRYLWRMNTRRLESEARPRLDVLRRRQSRPHARRPRYRLRPGLDDAATQHLFPARLRKADKFLELFDAASVNECYRRSESVVPQQALALANSDVTLNESRLLARKLSDVAAKEKSKEPDQAFVLACLRADSRAQSRPTAELTECRDFLKSQARIAA